MKKMAVDRFNDSRQEESRHLNLKQKMEHDEKMASIRLKRHKYDLQYGSAPQTPGSSTPVLATAAVASKEDKQIEILRLQIRLAELNQHYNNSAHTLSSRSQMPHASSSRSMSSHMPHNSLEEVSTPSSGMSGLSSYHNDFVNNPGHYDSQSVPNGEASIAGADMTNWPETYNFAT